MKWLRIHNFKLTLISSVLDLRIIKFQEICQICFLALTFRSRLKSHEIQVLQVIRHPIGVTRRWKSEKKAKLFANSLIVINYKLLLLLLCLIHGMKNEIMVLPIKLSTVFILFFFNIYLAFKKIISPNFGYLIIFLNRKRWKIDRVKATTDDKSSLIWHQLSSNERSGMARDEQFVFLYKY